MKSASWVMGLMLLILPLPGGAGAGVLLNEILAANSVTLLDEDGESSDWIELFNHGAVDLDLTGFTLSDDPTDPGRWVLPRATIGAGEFLLIFASGKDRYLHADHWESVIDLGDPWRFRVNDSEPPPEWRETWFDAGSWDQGVTGIGYGGGEIATEIPPCISLSCRTTFQVDDPVVIDLLALHLDYDDGFVAWLNGIEIARSNVDGVGIPPWDQPANYDHGAVMGAGGSPERFDLTDPAPLLQPGSNVLAIQLHNAATGLDDLTLIPFLSLGMSTPPDQGVGSSEHLAGLMPIMHTNFKLDASGEILLLANPAGTPVDLLQSGQAHTDISLGRSPDGSPEWLHLPVPTPGAANGPDGWPDFTAPPLFSISGGFHGAPLSLLLTPATAGSTVRYTDDGSEPDTTSPLSGAPISITGTTVIRARAYGIGSLPSPIVTHSYIIDDPSTLPVASFTCDPADLWDPTRGIFFAENIWHDWARPIHLEFWGSDGDPILDQDAAVKLFGGWSRTFPQKSLRLIARSGYGDGDFTAPLFDDRPYGSFRQLVWRNSGNDWCLSMLRDGLMHRLLRHTDVDRLSYRPTRTYLNGEYWGLLNLREHFDGDYLASSHGVDPEGVDIIKNYWELAAGSPDHYWEMISFIEEHDLSLPENFAVVESMMDTAEFAEYVIWQVFYANVDWPGNNIFWWRPQGPEGRWRWLLYDTDFGLGLESDIHTNSLAHALAEDGGSTNPPWSTLLLRRLIINGEFKREFINRYADHLAGSFLPTRTRGIAAELAAVIEPEMVRHMERWDHDPQVWQAQMLLIDHFLLNRPDPAREHLREQFALGGNYTLGLDISPPGAGAVSLVALTVDSTWSGLYFRGTPVTLTAEPAPGFRFRGWSDGNLPQESPLEIDPPGDYQLTALFETGVPDGMVVINEINYNSSAGFDTGDWVELHNPGNQPVDLGSWEFRDHEDDHGFSIPAGTQLPAGGYLVICQDNTLFQVLWPGVATLPGDLGFGFHGDGERLRLFDGTGEIHDQVPYGDQPPWPGEPDGTGSTLELTDPALDNALPGSWHASVGHGTPGGENGEAAGGDWDPPFEPVLRHPFPSPAISDAEIWFTLERERDVDLGIYDISGRRVRRLVNQRLSSGPHSTRWNGRDGAGHPVASGLYLIRLESEGWSRAVRLIMLR